MAVGERPPHSDLRGSNRAARSLWSQRDRIMLHESVYCIADGNLRSRMSHTYS